MQRTVRQPTASLTINTSTSPLSTTVNSKYEHRISMYTEPPSEDTELSLNDFESWAVNRVKLHNALEDSFSSGSKTENELRNKVKKYLPLSTTGTNIQHQRFKDYISHFILRLAFCQKAEDRARFVRWETRLFKIRWSDLSESEKWSFFRSLDLGIQEASDEEKGLFQDQLRSVEQDDLEPLGTYYKVPMENCMDLVKRRQVFIYKGQAFVPVSLRISLLANEFSHQLERALENLAKFRSKFRDDSRIEPVLHLAEEGVLGSQYTPMTADGGFKMQNLDQLNKENFLPLCASRLHDSLKTTRHAYNPERLQYQSFLVYMGLPLEEALKLYQTYYKDYKPDITYSVEYAYGRKGRAKQVRPYSCSQIFQNGLTAPAKQVYGCPFQRLGSSDLAKLLQNFGLYDQNDISEVVNTVKTKTSQSCSLACTKVYEMTHPEDTSLEMPIATPNMYFDQAFQHSKENPKGKRVAV